MVINKFIKSKVSKHPHNILMADYVWDELGNHINTSKSQFFEECAIRQIEEYDKEKLLREIKMHEDRIKSINHRIEIEEAKEAEKSSRIGDINNAMEVIYRIFRNKHEIGKNQIKKIAEMKQVNYKDLLFRCYEEKIQVKEHVFVE